MKIIVLGAGIGGATLAMALQRAGLDFTVLEQAEGFGEIGAGIQLSSNAVKVLARLGLEDRLAEVCCEPDSHKFKDWATGETILRTPLCPEVRDAFGAPYFHGHRPDLLNALTTGLDVDRIRFGFEVESVGEDEDGPWVCGADGEVVRGDVLIGADGIHSVVRDQIFQPHVPLRSGYCTWRGVIDAADVARNAHELAVVHGMIAPRLDPRDEGSHRGSSSRHDQPAAAHRCGFPSLCAYQRRRSHPCPCHRDCPWFQLVRRGFGHRLLHLRPPRRGHAWRCSSCPGSCPELRHVPTDPQGGRHGGHRAGLVAHDRDHLRPCRPGHHLSYPSS